MSILSLSGVMKIERGSKLGRRAFVVWEGSCDWRV